MVKEVAEEEKDEDVVAELEDDVFQIIEDALKRKAQDEVPPPEVADPTLKKISTVNQQAMERYI